MQDRRATAFYFIEIIKMYNLCHVYQVMSMQVDSKNCHVWSWITKLSKVGWARSKNKTCGLNINFIKDIKLQVIIRCVCAIGRETKRADKLLIWLLSLKISWFDRLFALPLFLGIHRGWCLIVTIHFMNEFRKNVETKWHTLRFIDKRTHTLWIPAKGTHTNTVKTK